MRPLATASRIVLAASVVAMCLLAFAWPFVISADPAQPAFRIVAIGTLIVFLGSLAVVLACKARRT